MTSEPRVTRGRPRNEERRSQIVRAAIEVFAQRGYEGATIEDIAAAACVTPSLFRHYFKRKSDLLPAIIAIDSQVFDVALQDVVLRAQRNAGNCESFIHVLAELYSEWLETREWLYVLWIQDSPRFQDQKNTIVLQLRRLRSLMAGVLKRMPGFVGDDDDAAMAVRLLFGGIMHALFFESRLGHRLPPPERRAFVKDVASLVSRAVTERPSRSGE